MAKDWLGIRIKTEPQNIKYVKGRIEGYPQEAFQKYFFQALQSMASQGVDVMRTYIETYSWYDSKGNKRRGRVDTGFMRDSVKWSGRKLENGNYRFEFGWLEGKPGYAIFQEQGTKNGVQAMNAIAYATEFMRNELRLMGNNPRSYKGVPNSTWEAK